MLARLRQRYPGASICKIAAGIFIRVVFRVVFGLFYRYRDEGVENLPRTGPLLLISNHQSFFDPLLVGIGAWRRRHCYALARASLFRNPLFGALIRFINAFPLDRGAGDVKAMRKAIDLMKSGQALMIFPEGTRTEDGAMLPFQPGMLLLVKRAQATVVPVAIDGAFDVWPRTRKLPKCRGRITVRFGEPIEPRTLIDMGDERATAYLRDRVESLRSGLHE